MPSYDDFTWAPADELERLARCEVPSRYYLETAVHFDDTELRGSVWPLTDGLAGEQPPLGPMHIVAAIQPTDDIEDTDADARLHVLDEELQSAGLSSIRAVGTSFDGTHSEESRAIFGLDDSRARALGCRYGQVAIFAWNGPRWSLLACAADRAVHRAWQWHEVE